MTDHLTLGSKPPILGTDCFGQRKLYPDNNPNSWKLDRGDIIFDFHDHSDRLGGPGWFSCLILDRWFFHGTKGYGYRYYNLTIGVVEYCYTSLHFWTLEQYLAHLNEQANNKKQSV